MPETVCATVIPTSRSLSSLPLHLLAQLTERDLKSIRDPTHGRPGCVGGSTLNTGVGSDGQAGRVREILLGLAALLAKQQKGSREGRVGCGGSRHASWTLLATASIVQGVSYQLLTAGCLMPYGFRLVRIGDAGSRHVTGSMQQPWIVRSGRTRSATTSTLERSVRREEPMTMSMLRGGLIPACLAVFVAAATLLLAACGGSSDGTKGFLFHKDRTAIFVQWTRTGDDISGSLAAAQVTQPRTGPQPSLFSTAAPPGTIEQQTGAFTGTVRDDSVRLLIGSGAASNRINGRLDGDTLELTIPEGDRAIATRLEPASHDDYTQAVREIREHEQERKTAVRAARARQQRADKAAITRVATAFQKALNPSSSDDPCRYVTDDVKERIRPFGDSPGTRRCTADIRNADADVSQPVSKEPLGVAEIRFRPLPPLGVSLAGGPDGAVVTWRAEPAAESFERGRTTMFIEQNGRWLVYRCCP